MAQKPGNRLSLPEEPFQMKSKSPNCAAAVSENQYGEDMGYFVHTHPHPNVTTLRRDVPRLNLYSSPCLLARNGGHGVEYVRCFG